MIDRALEIQGWMSPRELRWLAGQASSRRLIVEIGAWRGRSARAMGDSTTGVIWTVDDWSGRGWDYDEDLRNVRNQFYRNLADLIDRGRVIPLEMTSEKAAEVIEANVAPIDMVFIDGDHTYEAVRKDMALWMPFVTGGGLLCGHDFGTHEGVGRAVTELVPGVSTVDGTSLWYKEFQR